MGNLSHPCWLGLIMHDSEPLLSGRAPRSLTRPKWINNHPNYDPKRSEIKSGLIVQFIIQDSSQFRSHFTFTTGRELDLSVSYLESWSHKEFMGIQRKRMRKNGS